MFFTENIVGRRCFATSASSYILCITHFAIEFLLNPDINTISINSPWSNFKYSFSSVLEMPFDRAVTIDIVYAGGAVVNVLVDEVEGHWFNFYRYTPNERNGQPQQLSWANKEADRIRVSHQGDSMKPALTLDGCDGHLCTSREQNGQPHWLSPCYKEGIRILISDKRSLMMLPFDPRSLVVSIFLKELLLIYPASTIDFFKCAPSLNHFQVTACSMALWLLTQLILHKEVWICWDLSQSHLITSPNLMKIRADNLTSSAFGIITNNGHNKVKNSTFKLKRGKRFECVF